MNVSFYIARRYLFSKKSHNAINIISMVSVCGVVVATIALVCALSVYNGFNDWVSYLFSNFDPELKITPRTGKVFDPRTQEMSQVKNLPSIALFGEVLEENALVRYKERQDFAIIKGVDENYEQLTHIDDILIDGEFKLREDIVDYATLGIGLAYALGINAGFVSPLEIYAPKRDERVNLSNPATSFHVEYVYITSVFSTNQQIYDERYMIVPLALARELFRYENEVTAIELKLTPGADIKQTQKDIKKIIGDDFLVEDRYEQQAASFKMMQIEKWITFLILCFILTIALFNFVASLSMLMLEKQKDVRMLRNMGADDSLIKGIFLFEGWMIAGFGVTIGVIIGLILCYMQQWFGLIKLGQTTGAFIIDAYPIRVVWTDILIIFITVLSIGFLASWYPVNYLGKRWLEDKAIDN